jgi:hypothetical protein
VPTFWFHPWLYLLIGCILLPVTLRLHLRGGSVLPALFVLSGLSYMLGLFVAIGSTPYKYTVWTTFSVVLALALISIPSSGHWLERFKRAARRSPTRSLQVRPETVAPSCPSS